MKGKHKNIYLVLGALVLVLVLVLIFSGDDKGPGGWPVVADANAGTIAALGHGAFALTKISTFNDRVILEDELSRIYDNLNLRGIKDPKVVSLMTNLENTLTSYRLKDDARKKMVAIYDKKVEKGLMTAMGRAALVSINAKNRRSKDLLSKGAGPGTSLASAALSAMSASNSVYADYQRDMISYQVYLNESDWRLSPTEARVVAELADLFVAAYNAAVNPGDPTADRPGGAALFQNLIVAGSAPDAGTRHRILARLESEYRYIPIYWFLRAEAAAAVNRETPATEYSQDLSYCLSQYASYRGFFRRDEIYASIIMLDLSTFLYSTSEVEKKLAEVLAQGTEDDAPRRIFAALLCLRQGLFDKSAAYLQENINAQRLLVVSRTLMAEALGSKGDRPALWRLLDQAMRDPGVSNQEVLHYLGKISDQMVLQRFMPEVEGIKVLVDSNLFGPDSLVLTLPKRWLLTDQANLASTLNVGARVIRPTKAGVAAGGEYVNLLFDDVFRRKDLLESGEEIELYFELATEYYPVHFSGRLTVRDKEAEPGWLDAAGSAIAAGADSAGSYISEKAGDLGLWEPDEWAEPAPRPSPPREVVREVVFAPGEIATVESCWNLDDAYRLTPCR